jgi:hypothetical protein
MNGIVLSAEDWLFDELPFGVWALAVMVPAIKTKKQNFAVPFNVLPFPIRISGIPTKKPPQTGGHFVACPGGLYPAAASICSASISKFE